ncbi:MAG: AEC family transporter [Oxalobacter sp.]|nr:AEC family transporter [Oxalobacter sp.]
MLEVANIVLPVFALIALGYVFRRTGIMSAAAITELNRFVVYLALPALTIDIIISSSIEALWQPGFIIAFEIAVAVLFIPVLLFHWMKSKNLARATIDATAASYANTGYIGIPLCLLAFGKESLPPAVIAGILTVSFNFAFSIILMEISSKKGASIGAAFKDLAVSLIKNPLIVSPVIGGIMLASGIHFPGSVTQGIKLLGSAACPCALVATGLFLAQKQETTSALVSIELVLLKLIVQPLIAWFFAYHVFSMPGIWAKTAVILSAMPTGTGPFMLAEMYGKGAGIASRTILLSTIGSVITLFIWLSVL